MDLIDRVKESKISTTDNVQRVCVYIHTQQRRSKAHTKDQIAI